MGQREGEGWVTERDRGFGRVGKILKIVAEVQTAKHIAQEKSKKLLVGGYTVTQRFCDLKNQQLGIVR